MRVRSARHKSLCVAAYLLRCGTREWRRLWGRAATPKSAVPKSTVIVRKMLPLASCPAAHMNRSNIPYLLRFLFYELGHFRAGLLCLQLRRQLHQQLRRTIAPAEKGDQSGGVWGGFPLGWIHELRT